MAYAPRYKQDASIVRQVSDKVINPKFEIEVRINWNLVINEIQQTIEESDMCNDELIDYLIDNEEEYIRIEVK